MQNKLIPHAVDADHVLRYTIFIDYWKISTIDLMKSEKTVMPSSTDDLKSVSDEYFALLRRYIGSADETRDMDKCNGRFFTHEAMAANMITSLLGKLTFVKKRDVIRIDYSQMLFR